MTVDNLGNKPPFSETTSLDGVAHHLVAHLLEQKEIHHARDLAYVSGIISSDGPDKIPENMAKLQTHTNLIRQAHPEYLVFSASDIFTDPLNNRIGASQIPTESWLSFWEGILREGKVDIVYMTPRWEESHGARDEERVAKELGLKIIYLKDPSDTGKGE